MRSASGVEPGSPRGVLGAGRRDRPRGHGLAVWQAPSEAERGLAAGAAARPRMGRPPAAARTHGLGPGDPRPTAPVGARRASPSVRDGLAPTSNYGEESIASLG